MTNEEINKLFVVDPKNPMKFTILKGNMLNVKYNQLSKTIKKHGGVIIDYDEKDDECIVLAQKPALSTDLNIFNIKYIRDCISQNKVLNLQDYNINKSLNKNSQQIGECNVARKIILKKKCVHMFNRSAEEDLRVIKEL